MSETKAGHDTESNMIDHAIKGTAGVVKAIDELRRRWWGEIRDFLNIKQREFIQQDLGELRFDREEFKKVLDQIANGKFTKVDVDKIGYILEKTSGDVYVFLRQIKGNRKYIEKRFGATFWDELEKLVEDLKLHIREELKTLSTKRTNKEKQKLARELLKKIESFNAGLAKVRDKIVRVPRP